MRLTEAPVLPPLPPQEYAQLRDSIRERGVLQPILITADHVLIDGHERWKAIQELGLTKYPLGSWAISVTPSARNWRSGSTSNGGTSPGLSGSGSWR